jgi:hypothetical protein
MEMRFAYKLKPVRNEEEKRLGTHKLRRDYNATNKQIRTNWARNVDWIQLSLDRT